MSTHVVALFDDPLHAQQAVEDLLAGGVSRERIGYVGREAGHETRTEMAGEGAAAGLATGAVVGGVLGLLAGAGIGFVPAAIAVGGPLTGLLTGGAAGAATGGILGGLVGLGIPHDLAKTYEEELTKGGSLVAVECNNGDIEKVELILNRDGAIDVKERAGLDVPSSRTARYVRPEFASRDSNIPDGRRQVNAEDEFEPYGEIFQAHFSAQDRVGETYAQHEPAYRFGFDAARRDEFNGHDWSTAEAQLRDEWEQRRPGTWEQFRGAILAGWNRCHARVTSGASLI